MSRWTSRYDPSHPLAKDGWVSRSDYEIGFHLTQDEYRAIIGNQEIRVHTISDIMQPMVHMCDGKLYDSKSKFRQTTKQHGCIEIGNETSTVLKPRKEVRLDQGQRRTDIKRAIWELNNGRNSRRDD